MAAEGRQKSTLELLCWSDLGALPSVDPFCIQVMAYAKFAECPLKINACNNPWKSPTGTFPVLKMKDETETCPSKIIEILRQKNYNADYPLTAKQGAETMAFSALVKDKLYPAFLHMMWVDERNYTLFTRPWYASRLPFPLNYYTPGQIQRDTIQLLDIIKGDKIMSKEDLENKVIKEACECLNILSQRLGNSEFFFGESPSTLDAVVYSYAVLIRKLSLPSNKLHNHLQGCENLIQFCARINQRYFPDLKEDPSTMKEGISKWSFETRNNLISVGIGVGLLCLYAYYNGLSFRKQRFEFEDERYYEVDEE